MWNEPTGSQPVLATVTDRYCLLLPNHCSLATPRTGWLPPNQASRPFLVTSGDGQSRCDAAAIVADELTNLFGDLSHLFRGVSWAGRVLAAIGLPLYLFSLLSLVNCIRSLRMVVIYCMSLSATSLPVAFFGVPVGAVRWMSCPGHPGERAKE